MDILRIDRRGFLAGTGALALGVILDTRRSHADSRSGSALADVEGGDATPSLFISIRSDGTVDITCHRSEMGQQTWTAMAQIIADELEADWKTIVINQAEGHPRYGDQNTDGSRSVRNNFTRLRTAGAAMRTMLVRAAADTWKVKPASCYAELGEVVHPPSKRRLGYGELSVLASSQALPTQREIKLKPRSQWRYINRPVPSLTVPKIVRGQGTFGIDVKVPDMLYAVIARPPQIFGKVGRFDDSKTRATRGVVSTLKLPDLKPPAVFKPLGGIAVLARDTWSAIKGRKVLQVTWEAGSNADYDSEAYAEMLHESVRQPGEVRRKRGDVDKALASAATRIEAEYYAPHLSHSPMEPPSATARWQGDTVECWACVQAPQSARRTVAEACGIPEDDVTIHVTWLGGGFGRKSKPDFVAEAALIARAAKAPVKLTWTREDDL